MINKNLLLLLGAVILSACGAEKKAELPEERLMFRPVPLPTDSLARYPHLLADEENGRLWMSWMVQHQPDSASLWLAELDVDKQEWQQPQLITAGNNLMVNWADYPHVALKDKQPGILYLQIADPAAPYAYHVMWKSPNAPAQRLHSDSSATEHGFVSTAAMPDGRLGVVWLDGNKYAGAQGGHGHGDGGEMTLRFRTISAEGQLEAAQELDGRTCDCCNTAMVATSEGLITFYRDRSEEDIRDISYVRLRDGKWSAPKSLHNDNWEIKACPVNGPAADAQGEQVAVAWFTGEGGNNKVNVRFSADAGDSWGPVYLADSLQPMGRVDLQLMPSGSALISWLDKDGKLVLRQIHPQGVIGERQPLADSLSSRKSGFPKLVQLKDKVYVAWTAPEPQTHLQLMVGERIQ